MNIFSKLNEKRIQSYERRKKKEDSFNCTYIKTFMLVFLLDNEVRHISIIITYLDKIREFVDANPRDCRNWFH